MMTPWPRSWKQVLWLMSGTYGRKTTEEEKTAFSLQDKNVWNYESERISCSVMSDSLPPHGLAHQAHLFIEFSRQEYWSGLPFPSLGDLPNPGTEPVSSALQADSLPFEAPGKPIKLWMCININGLPWFLSFKESACQCRRCGFSLCPEDPLEKEYYHPLQYSCLGIPMDRGAWRATVHGVTRVR